MNKLLSPLNMTVLLFVGLIAFKGSYWAEASSAVKNSCAQVPSSTTHFKSTWAQQTNHHLKILGQHFPQWDKEKKPLEQREKKLFAEIKKLRWRAPFLDAEGIKLMELLRQYYQLMEDKVQLTLQQHQVALTHLKSTDQALDAAISFNLKTYQLALKEYQKIDRCLKDEIKQRRQKMVAHHYQSITFPREQEKQIKAEIRENEKWQALKKEMQGLF